MYGENDNDTIAGNEGDDIIYGGDGIDTLRGNAGKDKIYAGGGLSSTIYGDDGEDTITGGVGEDLIYGGEDNDDITGDAGDDVLKGDAGDDVLKGDAGNDTIEGGAGVIQSPEVLCDDLITGGKGADIISGGVGSDTFFYDQDAYSSQPDTITDFSVGNGGDKVDLTDLHSWSLGSAGDLWSGSEFAYTHEYIKFDQDGNDVIVKYDRDGLNGSYEASNIAKLENISVNNFIEGTNSGPVKSDKLFLLEKDKLAPGLAEDSSAYISYRAVLGEKPNADVTLSIAGGDQILVDGDRKYQQKYSLVKIGGYLRKSK